MTNKKHEMSKGRNANDNLKERLYQRLIELPADRWSVANEPDLHYTTYLSSCLRADVYHTEPPRLEISCLRTVCNPMLTVGRGGIVSDAKSATFVEDLCDYLFMNAKNENSIRNASEELRKFIDGESK